MSILYHSELKIAADVNKRHFTSYILHETNRGKAKNQSRSLPIVNEFDSSEKHVTRMM